MERSASHRQSNDGLRCTPPILRGLPENLLAVNAGVDHTVPIVSEALVANAHALLDQARTELNLTQGEVIMFIADMPSVPPQNVPVMIAQANQAQPGNVEKTRALGICFPVPSDQYSGDNALSPIVSASHYLLSYEQRKVQKIGTVTVLQQPKHGVLRPVTQADVGTILISGGDPVNPADGLYFYLPETGYLGKDKAVMLVEIGGIKIKLVYFFQGIEGPLGNTGWADLCSKTGLQWKISSTIDASGNTTVTSVEYQSPVTSIAGALGMDISGVNLNFADLPGGAVGQTFGTNITLDTNAAGHNWFIDPTPGLNEEYLPTFNPYEWQARAGTAAYGKMDMLSVLLHEYGHALGIAHSADSRDYMATTLTPGVRRMPSAEELALMQELVGQAKASSLTPDFISLHPGYVFCELLPIFLTAE